MNLGRALLAVAAGLFIAVGSFSPQTLRAAPQLLPGVYGYGLDRATNPAGFGSSATVVHVSTLEDNGNDTTPTPGSLRAAIKPSGSRIVVFDLSGVIELKATLTIRTPNLTIAGQTAPSPGIALHGQPLLVRASNVLIQHLRIRPGDRWTPIADTHNRDAVEVDSGNATIVSNVVFDHCTLAWSLDEMASTWNAWEDVTFNKCLLAEPLFRSIHLDEGTLPNNLPRQIETMVVTPTNFGAATPASSPLAVGGTYREWEATADGATLDFTFPILAATSASNEEHMVVGGITGPDRARFKVQVWTPNDVLLQASEVFDQYAPIADAVSYVARTDINGFTIPVGTTSLKVRITVVGRNPASTGWKLGLDLFSLSQGHAMGPLFGSGKEGAGRLAFNGSVLVHMLERAPWANAKHFVFANNIVYNRRNRCVMIGHNDYWTDPIHTALIGNTFIDGQSFGTSPRSPIAKQNPPAGTVVYAADNTYDPGDRTDAAPVFDPLLEPYRVQTDPTEKGHGLDGFVPLSAAAAYQAALLSAGARPNDRDVMEARVMNDLGAGATLRTLAQRPGKTKNSVAEAGGWPVYAQNAATWTLPANPNADDDNDGYTNVEAWLQQLSAQLEGVPTTGNSYQAEFALLDGGCVIVTNGAGAHGTGYVNAPGTAATGTLTFNQVDGGSGGARVLRIRYALSGGARAAEAIVNGISQGISFTPTSGANTWGLLDVPVTLARGTANVVILKAAGGGLPNIDEVTVATLDLSGAPVIFSQPRAQSAVAGSAVTFAVLASGTANTYQWLKDGVVMPGATNSSLTVSNVAAANTGNYSVVIINSQGSTTSNAALLTLAPAISAGRLVNLSVLTSLGAGGEFTMGYVIGGAGTSGAKPLVVRAAGPSLAQFGVAGPLNDPKLELFAGSTKTGENDNWGGSTALTNTMTSVGAFAFSGSASLDAAMAVDSTSRDNSVKVSAVGNGSGMVIAELYEATSPANFTAATPRLVNVSILKNVGTGLTVGFVIGGSTPQTVLIRAIGPTLGAAPFNLIGAIADPQVAVYFGQTKVGENNDWGGTAALSAAFTQVGAFALPAASRDAAILTTLEPGSYTVQVSGVNGTSGTAIVEVYEVR